MSWLDDLRMRAEQSLNSISGDINDYVKTRVTDAVVKIGEPPKGNLTAEQIASGMYGSTQGTAQAAAPAAATQNASQASQITEGLMKYMPLIAVAAVAYIILSRGKGK